MFTVEDYLRMMAQSYIYIYDLSHLYQTCKAAKNIVGPVYLAKAQLTLQNLSKLWTKSTTLSDLCALNKQLIDYQCGQGLGSELDKFMRIANQPCQGLIDDEYYEDTYKHFCSGKSKGGNIKKLRDWSVGRVICRPKFRFNDLSDLFWIDIKTTTFVSPPNHIDHVIDFRDIRSMTDIKGWVHIPRSCQYMRINSKNEIGPALYFETVCSNCYAFIFFATTVIETDKYNDNKGIVVNVIRKVQNRGLSLTMKIHGHDFQNMYLMSPLSSTRAIFLYNYEHLWDSKDGAIDIESLDLK